MQRASLPLLCDAPLVLLDEPFVSVDTRTVADLIYDREVAWRRANDIRLHDNDTVAHSRIHSCLRELGSRAD